MKYSIIIPTFNHLSDCLRPCCESIINNTIFSAVTLGDKNDTEHRLVEVIIVGNGCTDGTKEYVQSLGSNFIYLDYPEAMGYPKAVNAGLRIATGDYIVLLNNDTKLLDWAKNNVWLDMLWDPFKTIPTCGMTGVRKAYSEPADAMFLIFYCVMISRRCFETVGFLDEIFTPGAGEDSVTGDNPIIIKKENLIDIIPIEDLYTSEGEGRLLLNNINILTRNGFKKANFCYKHVVNKPIIRTITRTGCIDTTNDHSIFSNNKEVKPKDLKIGQKIDLVKLPIINNEKYIKDAWYQGLFVAEGTASVGFYKIKTLRKKTNNKKKLNEFWKQEYCYCSIRMNDEKLINKYGKYYGWKIGKFINKPHGYSKKESTMFGCYLTGIGRNEKIKEMRNRFYTKGGDKKIPIEILNANNKTAKEFLEGYFEGDGHIDKSKGCRVYTTTSKTLVLGVQYLFNKLGITHTVHCYTPKGKKNVYNIREWVGSIGNNQYVKYKKLTPDDGSVKFVKKVGYKYKNKPVYDINTDDGTFVCGIGGILAHNTDYCIKAEQAGFTTHQVPIGDEGHEDHQQNFFVSTYPMWHQAEATVNGLSDWNGIFERNSNILRERYRNNKIVKKDVTCVISTKNRSHTTLPMTIMAICNQSIKPNHLIIYDDGNFKPDLNKDPMYSKLFATISASGITWEYKYGQRIGQVVNHAQSLIDSKTEWIWRLDDDNVPEYNVLEGLLKCVTNEVGAVGGVVVNEYADVPSLASNKIEDIFLGINEQWFFHSKESKPKEVDHLYSSFIYRRSIAEYPDNLSPIGHREETILTYEIKRKDYKVIFNPSVKTWHFNNPEGGIRSESNQSNIDRDSNVFYQKMMSWGIKPNDYSFVVLEHGLGDTFAFKSILPQYFESKKDKKHVFFVSHPHVFYDTPNITIASIAEAKRMFGGLERWDAYKTIADGNWDKNLPLIYKKIYNIKGEVTKGRFGIDDVKEGSGKNIIISPYSFTPQHAKSYPFWNELLPMLKDEGYSITQIGRGGEVKIDGLDEYLFGLSFKDLEDKVKSCKLWIGVDNFFQHFINSMTNPIKGVVIWGVSDPKLFGYHYNLNILKSNNNLRQNQIAPWTDVVQNSEVFEKPEIILNMVKETLK